MAGERFDLSIFRRVVSDQLTLDHLELFPLPHDPDPETLPRVTLFRTTDLMNLRLAFRGLVLLDSPDGRVLRRADNANTGLISVLFGGQSLHEEAFFEVSQGIPRGGRRGADPAGRLRRSGLAAGRSGGAAA